MDEDYFPKPDGASPESWHILKANIDALYKPFLEHMAVLNKYQCKTIMIMALAKAHEIRWAEFTTHFTRPN